MAAIRFLSGSKPGSIVELKSEVAILGRHPGCQVVIDNVAISRQHAKISQTDGQFVIEDLNSRNGTFLNGEPVRGKVPIKDRDRIRICDVHFRFHLEKPAADLHDSTYFNLKSKTPPPIDPAARTMSETGGPQHIESSSSIIRTLEAGPQREVRLDVQPEAKLRAILEITRAVSRELNVDLLLPKVLATLFKIFPQAEHGFVALVNAETGERETKAAQSRSGADPTAMAAWSATVVDRAIESGEAILTADALEDTRFRHSESVSELKIRSMMCAPLISQSGRAVGAIQLDTKDCSFEFSSDDLELLVAVAGQAAMAVEGARLHEELLNQRDLERDLQFATQVQLGFLPRERPKVPLYEFFDYYEPAMQVGGDYFDYVWLPDGRLAIAQGDVSGKGVPAALLMTRVYCATRYRLASERSAGDVLTQLNAEISAEGMGFRFITLVIAILDPRTHELVVANAGHLPPIYRGPDRQTQFIGQKSAGIPLGIDSDTRYQEERFTLPPDAAILFYTDGLTEAMNADEELFGRLRLAETMAAAPGTAEDMIQKVVLAVEAHSHAAALRDDMCLVAMRRLAE